MKNTRKFKLVMQTLVLFSIVTIVSSCEKEELEITSAKADPPSDVAADQEN